MAIGTASVVAAALIAGFGCYCKSLPRNPRLSFESFGTATWLKNIVLGAFDYLLVFLGKGAWLKNIVLKKRLIIPDYLLDHLVWVYLIVLTTNWESNHSPLGIAYNYQTTTLSISLL